MDSLALQLQLLMIESSLHENQTLSHADDYIISLNLMRAELNEQLVSRRDQAICSHIDESETDQRAALEHFLGEEAVDRQSAISILNINEEPTFTCDSCRSENGDVRVVPCGHHYCLMCLTETCKMGLLDRMFLPSRCCKREFSIDLVEDALDAIDFLQYQRFMSERTAGLHSDLDSDRDYTKLVVSLGLKQCPGCNLGVDRISGCVHMTCPLGHEFCYTCLKLWKGCECELFPPNELEAILLERVPANQPEVRERVRHILMEDDDIHDHDWSEKIEFEGNRKRCLNCRRYMWHYYYECSDCLERSCGRCRYHR